MSFHVRHALSLFPQQEARQAALNRVAENPVSVYAISSVVKFWQYLTISASSQSSTPASQQDPFQASEPSHNPSEPCKIFFAYRRHSFPAKNHVTCVNFLKHASMQSALSHLQSELHDERKCRVYIAAVHAKIQRVAAQQKETIEKLEGTIESLQNDVTTATARLLAVQNGNSSNCSSITLINTVQNYGSDFDCNDDTLSVPKTRRISCSRLVVMSGVQLFRKRL
ncbi:hypothetical protein BJ741DRAFT_582437 [Chytriomyces cf. hyalinus JEL632]|nr:hypothetical protein BJ741DRAFT_582437 [Chytriomyces cf. hyalinus JEL632]